MENEEPTTGIGRRSLIKRAGIVGAGVAAWSSPSITTLASRAYAGSAPGSCSNCGLGGDTCGGQVQCNPQSNCYCSAKVDGSGCVCAQATFCDNQLCTTQADCPDGTFCLATCCAQTRCFVPCDNTQGVSVGSGVQPEGRRSHP